MMRGVLAALALVTAQLAEAYTVAGNTNDALVIPAGLALARARSMQHRLDLYAPTAKFLQQVAWDTVQDYYRK